MEKEEDSPVGTRPGFKQVFVGIRCRKETQIAHREFVVFLNVIITVLANVSIKNIYVAGIGSNFVVIRDDDIFQVFRHSLQSWIEPRTDWDFVVIMTTQIVFIREHSGHSVY